MDNFMSLKIKAVSENEAFARSAVAAFCVGANPTVDKLDDVKTAVSEAVTNCVVHGYKDSDGDIEICEVVLYTAPAETNLRIAHMSYDQRVAVKRCLGREER